MTQPARHDGLLGGNLERSTNSANGANLADILERVLDKGIVIAGDIQVNLLDIQLLTIKIRLLVASVDKAKEMGINWWEHDPSLSSGRMEDQRQAAAVESRTARTEELEAENEDLRKRVAALEKTTARPKERDDRTPRERSRRDRPSERRQR